MSKLPRLSQVTKHYLADFFFRLTVFLLIAALYFLRPELLDFTAPGLPSLPLMGLWAAVLFSMLVQLNPKSKLTTGCLKQYPTRYAPAEQYDPGQLRQVVHNQNLGALKVAVVWLAVNLIFGALYHLKLLRSQTLLLLCALYYLCDLICVLFFCPFQFFLMHNRCCVNCRIFAWGSWMMAAPLMCVPHWYSWSLVGAGLLVLAVWETRYRRYPQRFWFGSNKNLQCANCTEQLCRYKWPRTRNFS